MRYSSISNRTVVVESRPISSDTSKKVIFQVGCDLAAFAHLFLSSQGFGLQVDCEGGKEGNPGGG